MIYLSEILAEVMRKLRHKVAVGRRSAATIGYRESHVKLLLASLGDRPITDFAARPSGFTLVQSYIESEERAGRSGHTIQKRVGTLAFACREAHDMGILDAVPRFPQIDGGYRPRKNYLERDEYSRLMDVLTPKRRLWLAIGVWTGMHRSDVDSMPWEDFREREGKLEFLRHNRKNRVLSRWCKAPRELAEQIRAHTGLRVGLVVGHWGGVCRDLATACKRAGLDKAITPNDLRRTLATWWREAGVEKAIVKEYLGHTGRSSMLDDVYAVVTTRRITTGIDALDADFRSAAEAPSCERCSYAVCRCPWLS